MDPRTRGARTTLGGLSLLVALGCTSGGGTSPTATEQLDVWTLPATQRALRSARAPASSDRTARLSAARNEWESFQVMVRADAPIAGVTLSAVDLEGPAGARLSARNATCYREDQIEITSATWRNPAFEPGWYPDALIPFVHPVPGRTFAPAALRAVPYDLPAHETHGFWVDLYVPPDSSPGLYTGSYRVSTEHGTTVEIPVELTVWGFTLEATPALQTDFNSAFDLLPDYYKARGLAEPADWGEADAQANELMRAHRLNAFPPKPTVIPVYDARSNTYAISSSQVSALRAFIDRYRVNAIRVPIDSRQPEGIIELLSNAGEVDPWPRLRPYLDAWNEAIAALDRPQVTFYTYLKDEPNTRADYLEVQDWGAALRGGAVKVLVTEQPRPDFSELSLVGAVDIWCTGFEVFDSNAEAAAERRAHGESIWAYGTLAPKDGLPVWATDDDLVNYRAPAWLAWRMHATGLLYWSTTHWWKSGAAIDPWTQPTTWEEAGGLRVYNGEGMLTYPAYEVGYDGVVPSMRLAVIRDAIEDYDYMAMLERKGRGAQAAAIVAPLTASWTSWERDPAAYDRARAELAAAIMAP